MGERGRIVYISHESIFMNIVLTQTIKNSTTKIPANEPYRKSGEVACCFFSIIVRCCSKVGKGDVRTRSIFMTSCDGDVTVFLFFVVMVIAANGVVVMGAADIGDFIIVGDVIMLLEVIGDIGVLKWLIFF